MMVTKRAALIGLEVALRNWFWATQQEMPNVGVIIMAISDDSIDIQYLGEQPSEAVDWAKTFAAVTEQLSAGTYFLNQTAEVKFDRQR